MKKILIFRLILSAISLYYSVFCKDFCSDSEEVKTVFSMENINYLEKGDLFYTKNMSEVFAKTNGQNSKEIFKIDFDRVSTGFYIPSIPLCKPKRSLFALNSICDELEKLSNLGFVIGYRSGSSFQSYVSYRRSLTLIVSDNKMPFGLKAQNKIEKGFWPLTATPNTVYLGTTYDDISSSIFAVIQKDEGITLYVNKFVYNTWTERINPKVYGKDSIKTFIGFIHLEKNNFRYVSAFVVLRKASELTLVHLMTAEKYFMPQDTFRIEEDIYGCSKIVSNNSTTINKVSTPLYSTKRSQKNNRRRGSGRTDIPEEDEQSNDSSGNRTLRIIFIVLVIIGFVLFVVMIITIIYIRHQNMTRRSQKNKKKNLLNHKH